jgi:putative transposase
MKSIYSQPLRDPRSDSPEVVRKGHLGGAPRIPSELQLLGYTVAKATVAKYRVKPPKPPSQNGRTFLDNPVRDIVAIDFFTVPTLTLGILYCFLVLRHDRREVIHFNVTAHPIASWTAQQIVEAFSWDETPRYRLRDRDEIFNAYVPQRIQHRGLEEVVTAPRSPWQNPYVERVIGSIRRECLDHVIVLNERHLKRVLSRYFDYDHHWRTHLSLSMDSPESRPVHLPAQGAVIEYPEVGGLHHHYERRAA